MLHCALKHCIFASEKKQNDQNKVKKVSKMTQTIKFTKMHGAGNDYIYVDSTLYNIPDPAKAAVAWSAPHTGVGSDGLILIGKATIPEADYTMRMFNSDGSEGMMCGNGTRCIAKYLYDKHITDKTEIRLLTLSGVKILKLHIGGDDKVESVTVDMGEPILACKQQLATADGSMTEGVVTTEFGTFTGTFVSMGNPHFVIFVDDISCVDVAAWGRALELKPMFPERCNIEFAQKLPDESFRTRVWERGTGITMACGTGACATAVAAFLTERAGRASKIVMDGGTLEIEWSETDNHVYMTGPAVISFEGEIALPE